MNTPSKALTNLGLYMPSQSVARGSMSVTRNNKLSQWAVMMTSSTEAEACSGSHWMRSDQFSGLRMRLVRNYVTHLRFQSNSKSIASNFGFKMVS